MQIPPPSIYWGSGSRFLDDPPKFHAESTDHDPLYDGVLECY